MSDWSHGYDVSLGYTFGFYREMAPDWLDLCARAAGHAPRARSGSFRYLELGSGQGVGLCLLAAANPEAEFLGVDFHPEHVAHAEGLARAAGLANVRFSGADFLDLAAAWPEDFGTFDYVALHGVYSWVPAEVREAVLQCLNHATHAGGMVYASFNTQPGWLGTMPFQHITRLLKEITGKPGEAVLGDSIQLFDRLRAGGAATFQLLPALKARLDAVKTRNIHYLVQEYLNESWNPRWHSEVAREFGGAGFDYIGSATAAEILLPGVLPRALRETVAEQSDAGLRQDLQDFVINQSFRRDIFCRGARATSDGDSIGRTRLYLRMAPAAGDTLKVEAAFGEIGLQRQAYAGIVEALGTGPKTVAELAALPGMRDQSMANVVHLLLLLLHAGTLAAGAPDPAPAAAAQRLNTAIARGACEGAPYDHIAAAALGSALPVTDTELMLLDGWFASEGQADAATLANGAAERLAKLGRKPWRDGKPLESAEAQAGLAAAATQFLEQTLPHWRQLGALL